MLLNDSDIGESLNHKESHGKTPLQCITTDDEAGQKVLSMVKKELADRKIRYKGLEFV